MGDHRHRVGDGDRVGFRWQQHPESENARAAAEPDTPDESSRGSSASKRDSDLNRATGKSYRIFEGTVIETVLTNRLDGSFSGPVDCMVTTPVYSHDHQKVLIPSGSRVLGEA